MILVAPASTTSIQRLVDKESALQPTYTNIGGSLGVHLLPDSATTTQRILGQGRELCSGTQRTAYWNWQAHSGLGVRVLPGQTKIETWSNGHCYFEGVIVALAAPCRIIKAVMR